MPVIREILFLIRQFCEEERLLDTMHALEEETGFYFDLKYFEELVMSGKWDEAEKYLSGFTKDDGNQFSTKTFYEMRKLKFFEALKRNESAFALEILRNDLKFFAPSNEEMYREMTSLVTVNDFRRQHSIPSYGDVNSARRRLIDEIRLLIVVNPHFRGKLELPEFEKSRLMRLINNSLNWQQLLCGHLGPHSQVETLFFDHRCPAQTQRIQQNRLPVEGRPIVQPTGVIVTNIPAGALRLGYRNNSNIPSTPPTLEGAKDSQNAFRMSSSMLMDKMVTYPNVPTQSQNVNCNSYEDFPKTVLRCMDTNSCPTSMDFHPVKGTLLLVGTVTGEVEIWDVTSEVKLFWNGFMLWKRDALAALFLNDLDRDPNVSVRRVLWSPYGTLFGVAFSRHLVQLYAYNVMTSYIEKNLEIDAHLGSVNDLAFSSPNDQLLLITCGDDKLIQVWDILNGSKICTFEGHGAPVYSLFPHAKEDINFVFSTSKNGEIKAWLFNETAPRVEYDAPGHSCVRMAYSDDGKRLFSCGTNNDGESHLVEWNDTEGYLTRTYIGLRKSSPGVVQFCTSKNRFLVAGDEHLVKVWDMDNVEIFALVGANESLPARPYICLNKEGNLLAALTDQGKIKLFGNDAGIRLLLTSAFSSVQSTGYLSKSLRKEMHITTQVPLELNRLLNAKNCSRISQVTKCQSLRLPSPVKTNKICRLTYTKSGNGILALAADGIHLLWKWPGNEYIACGKATTNHAPCICQPRTGLAMINDLNDNPYQLVPHCFALSKNDSYLVSASGKMITLFNVMTFQKMRTCLMPPPVATCIAFYPVDNNVVAIGMDDSTILIYNIRFAQQAYKLNGHSRRISGLAFSNALKVLISAAVDAQIILWDCNTWQQKKSVSLQIAVAWQQSETSETALQLHRDHKHFLVVHETQLAVYEAINLERLTQWTIGSYCARISHATFSGDNQLVYAAMRDGIVMIFSSSDLSPRLVIDPSLYLPPNVGCRVYPLVVAANPQKPNQFAMGMSDGGVMVVEPPDGRQGKWTEFIMKSSLQRD